MSKESFNNRLFALGKKKYITICGFFFPLLYLICYLFSVMVIGRWLVSPKMIIFALFVFFLLGVEIGHTTWVDHKIDEIERKLAEKHNQDNLTG